MEGWEKHYPGMIEWQDPKMHGGVKNVDAKSDDGRRPTSRPTRPRSSTSSRRRWPARSRATPGSPTRAASARSIPTNMRSASDANMYVVGDACIPGDMPKSGFSANSQAKVAAMMIRGELANGRTFPARYTNTCWSLIETDDTVKVGGRYEPKDGKIAAIETFVSKTGESAELRKQTQAGEHRLVCRHHRRHFHLVPERRLLRPLPLREGAVAAHPATGHNNACQRRGPPLSILKQTCDTCL